MNRESQGKGNEAAVEDDFEFVICVDEREMWRGQDLYTHFLEIHRLYPVEQISIGWRSPSLIWV